MTGNAADAESAVVNRSPHSSGRTRTALGSFDTWRENNRDLGLTAILVMQVLIMFVVGPLASAKLLDSSFVEVLRIGMAATAVLIVNRYHPLGAAVALVFVVSLLGSSYVRTGAASQAVALINTGIVIVFDIAVASIVGHAAFGAGKITIHRIMGAVILYLYIGLIFSGFYRMVVGFDAASFSHMPAGKPNGQGEFLYFSMGALTSVGGARNIVPDHPMVRSLAVLESVIGQLYPAIFIGRLVTLHGTVVERHPRQSHKK
jgi:hypothetical protein